MDLKSPPAETKRQQTPIVRISHLCSLNQNFSCPELKGLFRYIAGVRALKMATTLKGVNKNEFKRWLPHMLVVLLSDKFLPGKTHTHTHTPKAQTWFSPENGGPLWKSRRFRTWRNPSFSRFQPLNSRGVKSKPCLFMGQIPREPTLVAAPHLKQLAGV